MVGELKRMEKAVTTKSLRSNSGTRHAGHLDLDTNLLGCSPGKNRRERV